MYAVIVVVMCVNNMGIGFEGDIPLGELACDAYGCVGDLLV